MDAAEIQVNSLHKTTF